MSVTLHKLQIKKFKGFTKLEPDTKIITMDFLSSATEVVAIFGELWDFVKFIFYFVKYSNQATLSIKCLEIQSNIVSMWRCELMVFFYF